MLCDDVKRVVYFFLDGSLAETRRADFQKHLEACRSCGDRTEVHRRLRIFIIRKLAPERAPTSLRERLTRALRGATV